MNPAWFQALAQNHSAASGTLSRIATWLVGWGQSALLDAGRALVVQGENPEAIMMPAPGALKVLLAVGRGDTVPAPAPPLPPLWDRAFLGAPLRLPS